MLRAATLLLLAVSAPAGTVSGKVYLRSGPLRRPLAGVRLLAHAADGSDLVGRAESDAQGRFLLADLPERRIVLRAARPGYVARAIASGEARLLLDLAADQSLDGADFELAPGGVITGRVMDSRGDPLEAVQISLWRVTYLGGRHRAPAGGASTDDRGIYRVFGLEPGRYILLARPTRRLGSLRTIALYYPGRSEESRAEEVEVEAGTEVAGIDINLGAEGSFRISGKVVGVEREQLANLQVWAATADRELADVAGVSVPDANGDFTLPEMPAGAYILSVSDRADGRDKVITRQRINLRANLTGLLLQPSRPGSLSGRAIVSPSARARPSQIRLRATDRDDFHSSYALAQAPDYRFEFSGLWSGAYALELVSPPDGYLKAPEIVVSEGTAATVEVEAAFDLSRLAGSIKAPDGSGPLAHARVALRAPTLPRSSSAPRRRISGAAGYSPISAPVSTRSAPGPALKPRPSTPATPGSRPGAPSSAWWSSLARRWRSI